MQTDRLIRYAACQTAIVIAATATVPLTGLVLLILLHTLEGLFCEQLVSWSQTTLRVMILTALATTVALGVRQDRQTKA